jgi:hypothetical protein
MASNVMWQLTLTLQAIEGERLMQFQSATAALLQRERPSLYQQANGLPREQPGVNQQPSYIVEVYQHAAEVMRQSLELEGVLFQYVPSDNRTPQAASGNWQDSKLATSLNAESSRPICLSHFELGKIIQISPHGVVLPHLDGDWLMSTSEKSRPLLDPEMRDALDKSFQSSQQLLVMPLFDALLTIPLLSVSAGSTTSPGCIRIEVISPSCLRSVCLPWQRCFDWRHRCWNGSNQIF